MTSRFDILATLAAGTFAGAQLMIGVSFAALWSQMTGTELVASFSGDWISIATTIIPFALLQTIVIPLSLYLAWGHQPARKLWTLALAGWLINCAITAIYHFPVVWTSMQGGYSAAEMSSVVDTWVQFHWVRVGLGYIVFLAALLATMRGRAE